MEPIAQERAPTPVPDGVFDELARLAMMDTPIDGQWGDWAASNCWTTDTGGCNKLTAFTTPGGESLDQRTATGISRPARRR